MSLEPKGLGRPDFSQISRGATTTGTTYSLPLSPSGSRLMVSAPELGTLRRIGTVTWVGSMGRLAYGGYLGTCGYAKRIGTLGHAGTFSSHIRGRELISQGIISGSRIGQGSIHTGGWQHIGSYRSKTFLFKSSRGGSIGIMGAIQGTATDRGTYYGLTRIGKGTLSMKSFTEDLRYVAPVVVGGGTVTVTLAKGM